MTDRIDVDAILAELQSEMGEAFWGSGDDPWGGANLASCGSAPCCVPTTAAHAETPLLREGMATR